MSGWVVARGPTARLAGHFGWPFGRQVKCPPSQQARAASAPAHISVLNLLLFFQAAYHSLHLKGH